MTVNALKLPLMVISVCVHHSSREVTAKMTNVWNVIYKPRVMMVRVNVDGALKETGIHVVESTSAKNLVQETVIAPRVHVCAILVIIWEEISANRFMRTR